jgi:hypothetical protein
MFSTFGFIGCGGKPKKATPKEILGRSGSQVESTPFQYVDKEPTISATGERILYISGRDSTEGQINQKVFRIDWPLNQAPKDSKRLTNTDLGQEQEVALSPDGNYAVIGALKDLQKDLFLQPIDSDGTPVRSPIPLTQSKDFEDNGEFSPDSKYFAWVTRVGTKSEIRMISTSEVAQNLALPEAKLQVGDTFEGQAHLVWIPTDDSKSYRILIARSKVGNLYKFEEALFSDPKNITFKPISLPSPYDQGVVLKKGVKLTANKRQLFLVQDLSGSSQESVERVGDAPLSENGSKEKSAVFSKILGFDHATFNSLILQDNNQEPLGIDTLSTSWNVEGRFGLLLNRSYFRCQEDAKPDFGTAILWADLSDISTSTPPKFTRKTFRFAGINNQDPKGKEPTDPDPATLPESWLFSLKDGFCGRRIQEGLLERIDNQINYLSMNALATQNQFRMVYSSRFVPRVDSKCELKAGDLEVRALEWQENQATFYPLSPNRAPIKNAPTQERSCQVYW